MSQDLLHRSVSRLHSTMALSHTSLPVPCQRPTSSEADYLMYSASLAHIRRQADYSDYHQKPAPYRKPLALDDGAQPRQPHTSLPAACSGPRQAWLTASISISAAGLLYYDFQQKPAPYYIRWVYGYNSKAELINLNCCGSTTVFYAACNCGVLYNWTTNQMRILQGHRHMVTCIAADADGKWLVTADSGPENIITIWDSRDYFPNKTYFLPHGDMPVSKVALSADAKYMLTLGYKTKAVIFWWIWSSDAEQPHAALDVDIPKDGVLAMGFNPDNSMQFLLMTKNDIWIGVSEKIFVMERGLLKETDDYQLLIRKPEKKVNPDVGRLTCYAFISDTSQVLGATSKGAVLVYGYAIEYQKHLEPKSYEHLKFIKVLKIEEHKINVIKYIDGVVVTGNNVGEIRFYDDQLKLLYWVHGFTVDSVRGLAFNISPRSYEILDPKCKNPHVCLCIEKVVVEIDPLTGVVRQKLIKKKLASDATAGGKPFVVRDFIVCTYNQGIAFVNFVTEKLETIMDYRVSPVLALTVHPEKPFICTGFADGVVDLTNFEQHKLFARTDLRDHYKVVSPPDDESINCNYEVDVPQLSVTCLKYSPSGLHLACGLNTGQLLFLDPVTVAVRAPPFQDTKCQIKEISFSADSLTMAFSDTGRTVGVYKFDCDGQAWRFVGKHRAHYKDVTAVFFTTLKNPDGEFKLLSLGADRIMVEYNIGDSSEEFLEIYSLDRIDQTAVPLATVLWPTPTDLDPEQYRTDLPNILIATDEHKYKILNYGTTMTLSTVLGPRYETPVCKMQLVTQNADKHEQYLVFATKHIIGLQKMPLDGNPWKHGGMLGHPKQISQMCFREDSGTLFTIGAKDTCTCQWITNYKSVDLTTKKGGVDLDPYYCLIEGGRPGWLFQEIRDLFYYIQILCQGTFSPAMRKVKDLIPIDSLPDLMRALGFFPSEYEVENLLTEARYKVYRQTPCDEVDFEEFVRLYLNHRPALGQALPHTKDAFKVFAAANKDGFSMPREDFVDMLANYSEHFPPELSWYLLSILSGHSFEDRANMLQGDFSFLPEEITMSYLLYTIMGIQPEEPAAPDSPRASPGGSDDDGSN